MSPCEQRKKDLIWSTTSITKINRNRVCLLHPFFLHTIKKKSSSWWTWWWWRWWRRRWAVVAWREEDFQAAFSKLVCWHVKNKEHKDDKGIKKECDLGQHRRETRRVGGGEEMLEQVKFEFFFETKNVSMSWKQHDYNY